MWCETAEKAHPLKFFRLNKRIRTLLICALLSAFFIRSSLAENNNAPSAASKLAYQNLLFYYEQGNYLETLVRTALQAQPATQDTRQKDRQTLLTRAYLQAGLFDEAENSLHTTQKIGLSNEENNELLLSLAEHYADQQNMTALNNTLQQLRPSQSVAQNNEKNYLLGRYFFAQANYSASSLAFADVTKNAPFYPYTRYNLAMSQLKNNQAQHAETTLTALFNSNGKQTEYARLHSRCALALGQIYLQTGQNEKAREILGQIESNGIDSNAALLGLGRSYQLLGQNDKALATWQVLSRQNAMDSSVQHALLWIAMHYENTKEQNQAVSAYQHAINRYNEQLQALQQSQQGLKDSTWLELIQLSNPVSASSDQPNNLDVDISKLPVALTSRLYPWFASEPFKQAFQNLLTIQNMQAETSRDTKKLLNYQELLERYPARQHALQQRSQNLLQRSEENLSQTTQLMTEVSSLDAENSPPTTEDEQDALHKLRTFNIQLQTLDRHPSLTAERLELQTKISLLMQAIRWKQFEAAPARLAALKRQSELLGLESKQVSGAQNALKNAEQTRIQGNIFLLTQRNTSLLANYQALLMQLNNQEQTQKEHLNALANAELETQKKQLNRLVIYAELALARLEDTSSTPKVKKHVSSP